MAGIDLEAARRMLTRRETEKKDEGSGGGNDILWYKLPDDGMCKLRVGPPWEGASLPGKFIYKHYNIPEANNITCFKTWDMECPICKMLEQYAEYPELIADFKYIVKSVINVLPIVDPRNTSIKTEFPPNKWHILMSGDFTLTWLIERIIDPDNGDVTDPRGGHSVEFKRRRKGGPFDRNIVIKPSPIADTEAGVVQLLSELYNLDKIWKHPDDAYVHLANEAAEYCRKAIVLSLISEPGTGSKPTMNEAEARRNAAPVTTSYGNVQTAQVEKVDDAPPFDMPTGSSSTGSTPVAPKQNSGHPECWGQHDPSQDRCMICPHEVACMPVSVK